MPSPSQFPHPAAEAEQLRCDVSRDGERARVRVTGALDLATVPILEAHLGELRDAGVRELIVDFHALEFMDVSGLRCVLERDADARRDGFSLALVRGPGAVQRVFDLTGTAARLRFVDG